MPIQLFSSGVTLATLVAALAATTAFYVLVGRRSLTDLATGRKRLALCIRLCIVVLVFLALAGAHLVVRNDTLAVLYVVDASRSVRAEQRAAALRFIREADTSRRPGDSVGLITFGEGPELRVAIGSKASVDGLRHLGAANATNIGQALDMAYAVLPRNTASKVVVLSDFNENAGSTLAAVPSLTSRGVQGSTVVLPSTLKREALVEKMLLPARVKIGEPFTVRVFVNAVNAQNGEISLYKDGKPAVKARAVRLLPGRHVYDFEASADKPGIFRYQAELDTDPDQDTIADNNRGLGFVMVQGKPRVLYVSSEPRLVPFLRSALREQSIDVVYSTPAAMPSTPAGLQQYDSVVVSDVPADLFTQSQLAAIQTSTRDFGTGFAMIGGADSFGLGGYRGSVVEEMLPVSLEIRKMQRFPPVTVALVIDRSGSMAEPTAGGTRSKLNLALEAAIRSVQALKPGDKVAVITFTFGADVAVPLTPVDQSARIVSAIQTISEGGGTSVFSGAELGFETIAGDEAPVKHIILLTDGQSNDPDWRPLLAKMRNRKITMSTIGIGTNLQDINGPLLAWLARETKGRFYAVQQASDIPRIYLQEIERISSRPVVEEPFTPRGTTAGQDILPGIPWTGLPPLLGYNVAIAKPTADVLAVSHHQDPILATWRYGLGRSLAFTSDDKNRWAVHWLSWPGYGPFWAQAIRWTLRSFTPSEFMTQVSAEGTRGHVTVDALDESGRYVNRLSFRAKVAGPDSDEASGSRDVALRQTGPGRYEAWFETGRIGTYLVNVTRIGPDKSTESTVAGLVVPYSPEYRDIAPNEFLLTQLARAGGGSVLSNPSDVFSRNRPGPQTPIDLTRWLLLAALLLFPIDVGVRRLVLQRDDMVRAWAWIAAHLPRRRRTRAHRTPAMSRLHGAKRRAAARLRSVNEERAGVEARAPEPQPPTLPQRGSAPNTKPAKSGTAASGEGLGRLLEAKRRAAQTRSEDDDGSSERDH